MVITDIKKNQNNSNRFSVFIDDKYAFAISDALLIESKIAAGDNISKSRAEQLRAASSTDKIYFSTLKYVSARLKTIGEVNRYLEKKGASPALIDEIVNKLSKLNLINDEEYIRAYLRDRLATRPASKLKIEYDLRKKFIDRELIKRVLNETEHSDLPALKDLIIKKRSYYKDDKKLASYLVRQGFKYGDINEVLNSLSED